MKPFRGWDGEGITVDASNQHLHPDLAPGHYFTLLANSENEYIYNPKGLPTQECLDFLCYGRAPAFNVWYSFGYDVTKILQDLPLHGYGSLQSLWDRTVIWRNHYFIKYIPRKFFDVQRKGGKRFISTDVFSFFQCSFLKACKDWGLDPSGIEAGKDARSQFATWSKEQIIAYNKEEMDLLVELMNRLRSALTVPNLVPSSWHGPGAIASRWLGNIHAKQFYGVWSPDVDIAARHAFFGGRIDCRLVGEELCEHSDIESAYPAAIANCPSLESLEVRHVITFSPDIHPFGLYHVSWKVAPDTVWTPLPWRAKHGTILWPTEGEGWYWGIEVLAALRYFPLRFHEAYLFKHDGVYPFREKIEKQFAWRKELKDAGDPASNAIKLGHNSLFGKTCQHVAPKGKRPPWQNILWAGFITATTRAKLLDVLQYMEPEDLIAVCTDGVFTRKSIPNPGGLGGFELKHKKTPSLFIAPGIYSVHTQGEVVKAKQRGIPANVNFGWILRSWGCTTKLDTPGDNTDTSAYTKFIGIGMALHVDKPIGTFHEDERRIQNVSITGTSKRLPEHPIPNRWKQLPLYVRDRPEEVISYPYIPKTRKDEEDE
jgi:hypothetical protein